MPLEGHYCCLLGGTTVAPLVLLLMPSGSGRGVGDDLNGVSEEAFL